MTTISFSRKVLDNAIAYQNAKSGKDLRAKEAAEKVVREEELAALALANKERSYCHTRQLDSAHGRRHVDDMLSAMPTSELHTLSPRLGTGGHHPSLNVSSARGTSPSDQNGRLQKRVHYRDGHTEVPEVGWRPSPARGTNRNIGSNLKCAGGFENGDEDELTVAAWRRARDLKARMAARGQMEKYCDTPLDEATRAASVVMHEGLYPRFDPLLSAAPLAGSGYIGPSMQTYSCEKSNNNPSSRQVAPIVGPQKGNGQLSLPTRTNIETMPARSSGSVVAALTPAAGVANLFNNPTVLHGRDAYYDSTLPMGAAEAKQHRQGRKYLSKRHSALDKTGHGGGPSNIGGSFVTAAASLPHIDWEMLAQARYQQGKERLGGVRINPSAISKRHGTDYIYEDDQYASSYGIAPSHAILVASSPQLAVRSDASMRTAADVTHRVLNDPNYVPLFLASPPGADEVATTVTVAPHSPRIKRRLAASAARAVKVPFYLTRNTGTAAPRYDSAKFNSTSKIKMRVGGLAVVDDELTEDTSSETQTGLDREGFTASPLVTANLHKGYPDLPTTAEVIASLSPRYTDPKYLSRTIEALSQQLNTREESSGERWDAIGDLRKRQTESKCLSNVGPSRPVGVVKSNALMPISSPMAASLSRVMEPHTSFAEPKSDCSSPTVIGSSAHEERAIAEDEQRRWAAEAQRQQYRHREFMASLRQRLNHPHQHDVTSVADPSLVLPHRQPTTLPIPVADISSLYGPNNSIPSIITGDGSSLLSPPRLRSLSTAPIVDQSESPEATTFEATIEARRPLFGKVNFSASFPLPQEVRDSSPIPVKPSIEVKYPLLPGIDNLPRTDMSRPIMLFSPQRRRISHRLELSDEARHGEGPSRSDYSVTARSESLLADRAQSTTSAPPSSLLLSALLSANHLASKKDTTDISKSPSQDNGCSPSMPGNRSQSNASLHGSFDLNSRRLIYTTTGSVYCIPPSPSIPGCDYDY